MMKQEKEIALVNGKLSWKEIAGYSVSGFGQNIICGLVSSYILIFYTEALGISAVAASVIMFAARIFDAFNDPIMGSIVDKTRTRWGKLRPYLLFTPLPIGILTVVCFTSPEVFGVEMGASVKVAYAAVFYVLWGVMFTIIDVPYWGLSSAMTDDTEDRSKLLTVARLACTVGAGVLTLIIPQITSYVNSSVRGDFVAKYGENFAQLGYNEEFAAALQSALQPTYFWIAVVCAVVGSPLFLSAFFGTRERMKSEEKPTSLKHNISLLFKNKQLLWIVASCIVGSVSMVYQYMFVYLAKYNFGDESLATWMSILIVPLGAIGSVIIPLLGKKMTKKSIYIWAKIFAGVVLLVMYFVGYKDSAGNVSTAKMIVLAAGLLLLGLPAGCYNVLTYAMIGDTVDYLEYKTGERGEGICFSMQTFISKITMAFCSLAVGLCLGFSNYFANTDVPAENVTNSLYTLATLGAAISSFASIGPILFFTFTEEKQKAARAELDTHKNGVEND